MRTWRLSRQDILLDAYAKELVLEAHVLSDLVRTRVLPPCLKAQRESCDLLLKTREAGLDAEAELASALTIRNHVLALQRLVGELDAALEAVSAKDEALARARAARETLLPLMADVRLHADAMERLVDDRDWTLPKYSELLWMH